MAYLGSASTPTPTPANVGAWTLVCSWDLGQWKLFFVLSTAGRIVFPLLRKIVVDISGEDLWRVGGQRALHIKLRVQRDIARHESACKRRDNDSGDREKNIQRIEQKNYIGKTRTRNQDKTNKTMPAPSTARSFLFTEPHRHLGRKWKGHQRRRRIPPPFDPSHPDKYLWFAFTVAACCGQESCTLPTLLGQTLRRPRRRSFGATWHACSAVA